MREQKDRGVEGAGNWEEFLNFFAFFSSFPLLFDEEFCSSCMLFVIFFIFSFFLWARTPRDLPKMLKNKNKNSSTSKKVDKVGIFGFCGRFFDIFFVRISGNLKVLHRDSGVYSPTVKRESKNSSIQSQKWLVENRDFFGRFPCLKTSPTCGGHNFSLSMIQLETRFLP